MRTVVNSSLSLSLVLACGLFAQSVSGYLARGTVTLTSPAGAFSGSITVDAAPGLCKITIDLASPGRPRQLSAVVDGKHAQAQGPAALLRAVPLTFGPRRGCALLVPPAAGAASLSWNQSGRTLTLGYGYGGSPGGLPARVTETVDGVQRLSIRYESVQPQTFSTPEFHLAPAGGAQ